MSVRYPSRGERLSEVRKLLDAGFLDTPGSILDHFEEMVRLFPGEETGPDQLTEDRTVGHLCRWVGGEKRRR